MTGMLPTLKRLFTQHGSEAPDLEVLVHCFSWCSCGSETYSADHIKLMTFKRTVKPGQAVALSYGIGDFDRQKHLFGHVDGLESKVVRLEFGGEWEIEGLSSALVALSEKHGAVWLDQLSIPQDPASITSNLQNMPQIYRGFEVVVLLPNAPCSCLKDAFDSWTSEGLHAMKTGDLDMWRISIECMNAFPVSSYHFRLWTKQEFSYARTISIHYCGEPGTCLRGAIQRGFEELVTVLQGSGHLSRWASWKYASCTRNAMASNQSESARAMGYSTFRAVQDDGKTNLQSEVSAFGSVGDRLNIHTASFLLGKRLHRDRDELENLFMAHHVQSEHVASSQKDFALAVLPAADGYRLPQGHAEMTLPELVDDGVEQYQRESYACFKTKLPRGLFDEGITSMGPKPSLHLRTENIRCLRDVYGSLLTTHFPNIALPIDPVVEMMNRFPNFTVPRDPWLTPLHLRDVPPRPSRLTLSKTYAEAFGRASTAEVSNFILQLPVRISSESRVRDHHGWAIGVYHNGITVPVAGWPSVAHEQAILEILTQQDDHPWKSSWPEIDHERACYNIMCDHVCIHPDVAREKGLGLVVKTSDPPCIGFVNRVVYDRIRATEQYQHRHGSPAPRLWRRQNGIDPEDWLTITLNKTYEIHQTLEVVRVNTWRNEQPVNRFRHAVNRFQSRYKTLLPTYVVRGVWYGCLKDDACIGADLTEEDAAEGYDAVLK
jgi:hypothetical protein